MPDSVVSAATCAEDVEALRPVWRRLHVGHVDSDIDYMMTVCAHAPQVISPYVIHIQRAGLPDMLIAARLERLPVRLKVAYWTLAHLPLRAIVVTFGGVLGARNANDEAFAMEQLRSLLAAGAADAVLMRNVDPDGTLNATAVGGLTAFRRAFGQPTDHLWAAPLAATLDAFLCDRSAKTRSSFRREDRLLREEFGDALKPRCFRQPSELDELCRDMAAVSARTYQGTLGAGFANSPMERALVSLGLAQGRYRCWMLYVGERPIAFWAGMAHGTTFYPTTPGFDPAYSRRSIGRYTMFRMIEDLCAEEGIERIDFGRGDAQYKTEYAQIAGRVTDVWIAAARPWPMLVIAALTATGIADRMGRRALGSLGWTTRIKSAWRRRLSRPARTAS